MKAASAWLVTGAVGAAFAEAIAATAVSLGRSQIGGDTHATPDELAGLDIAYVAMKLLGFMLAPSLMARVRPAGAAAGATLVLGAACLVASMSDRLPLLVALRAAQGLSGGLLLVSAQALLFLAFPRGRQPALQALFAAGSVVAPAAITPALGGWLLDQLAWHWIFFSAVPLAMVAAACLLMAEGPELPSSERRPFDWIGCALLAVALGCLTVLLGQGSRWNWFDDARTVWFAVGAAVALAALLIQQLLAGSRRLVDFSLFRSDDFSFACAVSLVAGAALFGTAFLIPAFAVSRLSFTPTSAGLLLLPGSVPFVGALFLAAWLMQARRMPPIATVPFGIVLIVVAMGLFAGSTAESGAQDMMAAVLLRGLGLGFLFLAITFVAFGDLPREQLAAGIGLFNTGRQLGGLAGVAGLQTLIDHEAAAHATVLAANVTVGVPAVAERIAAAASMLAARGLDPALAATASVGLLGRSVAAQSAVIAFDTAFLAIALFLVAAAPVLVGFKAGLRWMTRARAGPGSRGWRLQHRATAVVRARSSPAPAARLRRPGWRPGAS